ncbi:Fe-S cluster assembly protein SufD [Pedobacter cryoconitis]|uniref:Fe-S cluster assembly protein SufD n=1 Tax=Pedobacter cryoconitis TaxID=188932 RepID=UPI0016157E13|nr:Fe-S cluster assembly protein SufD [Pedobacter cryoconitis]MBB6270312.1 Fe-S cluster assembly protein SufD [Pedobacter cryoconitis]
MVNQLTTPFYNQLVAEFENTPKAGNSNVDLSKSREDAFELFKAKGFPTSKDEDWKFTNLAPFLTDTFSLTIGEVDQQEVKTAINNAIIPGLDAWLLVLLNGKIQFDLSVLPEADQLSVLPLESIINTESYKNYITCKEAEGNRMYALNAAFFTDGYFIEVPKNVVLDKPVQIIHLYTADENMLYQPRHLIIVNEHAKAELIDSAVSLGHAKRVLMNSVSQITVKENANLIQYVIQDNAAEDRLINYNHVTQERNSRYDNFMFNLPGAELIRNNLEIVLNGTATETHLLGLYLVAGHQLTDNHTAIHHRFPHCDSNEIYKGVLLDKGKAVFNGKVFVERPAQKTNAFQQNNNLLLSDKAQVFAKPQLEIFADDVKCSHGCTVGQFDPESLFYLQSRGISEESARKLLVEAFMFDVTQKIENEAVKDFVQSLIYKKMENSLSTII